MDKPIVMIVDDTPTNIQPLVSHLQDEYRIKVANSGKRC